MLHAALMGFPGCGKSTLFQLMTSARDSPHGKGDTAVGISKVPDPRLDRLTAIFNPKKRVPATIEFIDFVAPGKGERCRRSSTWPATGTPMRWSMSCARSPIRRFRIRRDRPIRRAMHRPWKTSSSSPTSASSSGGWSGSTRIQRRASPRIWKPSAHCCSAVRPRSRTVSP